MVERVLPAGASAAGDDAKDPVFVLGDFNLDAHSTKDHAKFLDALDCRNFLHSSIARAETQQAQQAQGVELEVPKYSVDAAKCRFISEGSVSSTPGERKALDHILLHRRGRQPRLGMVYPGPVHSEAASVRVGILDDS